MTKVQIKTQPKKSVEKKEIVVYIKAQIEAEKQKWIANYVSGKYQAGIDTPAAKKEVESAKFNMATSEQVISWFTTLLEEESK